MKGKRRLEYIHQRLENIQNELAKFNRSTDDTGIENHLLRVWEYVDNALVEIEVILAKY